MATKKITELPAAGSLTGAELFEVVQSGSSKKGLLSAIVTFVMTYLAPTIHAATAKTTPVAADEFGIVDSAASNVLKKITFTNLWTAIQSAIKGSPSTLYVATANFVDLPSPSLYSVGTQAWASDLRCAVRVNAAQTLWRPVPHVLEFGSSDMYLGFGGSTYTWSRAASGVITITAAAHTLTADYNGATVHLTQGVLSTGTPNITTGWNFTNFTYVDANTFTVQSTDLSAGTGTLGSNTAETFFPTLQTLPAGLMQRGDAVAAVNFGMARFKNNANNKTILDYYGSVLAGSTVVTTNTSWQSVSSTVIVQDSTTTYRATSRASVSTMLDTTFKRSFTLAVGTDWYLQSPYRMQFNFHS